MPGRSIRIARIAGIPIGISPWWLVIVGLITWSLGADYFPNEVEGLDTSVYYLLGFASALLLFASILLHELGHALVARRHGIKVQEIELWLLGGVSKMHDEAHDPSDELRYALAGPAVTAAIAALFGAIALALPRSSSEVVRALVDYQLLVNALILGFNMLPAFPLDGGRVLRSILWRRSHDLERSTATAAVVGRAFGYAMVALGVLELFAGGPAGLWLAIVGLFLIAASGAQAASAQVQATFSGVRARDLMSTPVVSLPADISLQCAGDDYFSRYRYTAFPVIDMTGRFAGVLALGRLEQVPVGERALRRVGEIADHDPQLAIAEDDDVATLLTRPAFARVGRAAVIDGSRVPVGLLSITDIQRALRAHQFASGAATRSPKEPSEVSSG
jgi:Zn-dependent protease/CBS domain-containing protein